MSANLIDLEPYSLPTILLAGTSGSGKTTVAEVLCDQFPGETRVLALDNYERLGIECRTEEDGYINWEDPATRDYDTLHENIRSLQSGQPAFVPTRLQFREEMPGDCLAITYEEVKPAELLIVEGHLLLCDERIRKMGTLAVFLDNSDTKIRYDRRLHTARDQYYDNTYFIQGENLSVLPTRFAADLIIDTHCLTPLAVGKHILSKILPSYMPR